MRRRKRKLGTIVTLVTLLIGGVSPSLWARTAASRSQREMYDVNAQYRGEIKKTYRDIGWARANYSWIDDERFRIKADIEVRQPEKKDPYQIAIDAIFRLEGNMLSLVEDSSRFNEASRSYQDEVMEAAPFIFLLKMLPPKLSGDRSRRIRYRGETFRLEYVPVEGRVEAYVKDSTSTIAKAMLDRGAADGSQRIVKFRIPEGKMMMSFVTR